VEGRDFTGHVAFRETLHGPSKLEIDPATAEQIENWVQRLENVAERMERSGLSHCEAANQMASAGQSMREAAGTMYMASRRSQ
jgi:hypothetical protein